jgi:hypothetical protein
MQPPPPPVCAEVWPFGPTPPLQSAGDGVDHSVIRPLGRRLMHAKARLHILRHPGPAPHPLCNLQGTASIIHSPVMRRRRRRGFIVQLCGGDGEHAFSSYAEVEGVKGAPVSCAEVGGSGDRMLHLCRELVAAAIIHSSVMQKSQPHVQSPPHVDCSAVMSRRMK